MIQELVEKLESGQAVTIEERKFVACEMYKLGAALTSEQNLSKMKSKVINNSENQAKRHKIIIYILICMITWSNVGWIVAYFFNPFVQ